MNSAFAIGRNTESAGSADMQTAATVDTNETETEEETIRRYDRLIGFFARRFRVDVDDLTQVGRVALLQAHRAWPNKPHTSSFWTYARKAVLGEMLNYMTKATARASEESFLGPQAHELGLVPTPFSAPDDACEAREHVASLTEREASVLEMYVAGYPVPRIAEMAGISRSRAYQILEGSLENIRRRA